MTRNARWLVVGLLLLCGAAVHGQGTAGYSEYYLPGDELNMYYIFDNLDDNATGNTGMHSVTSVVAWSASTTVYYDHWENGYNFDPANPGSTADETVSLPAQGDIQTFESSNVPSGGPPPAGRNPAATCPGQGNPGDRCYDGGDRLYVAGGPVTVTRAVWMEARGAGNQGDAWEVYPVQPQLTTYVLPFGENNYATSATYFTGFERVFALIQATAPNTVVTVDLDANGTNDTLNLNRDAVRGNAGDAASMTLQTGETFLLDRISACTAGANCTTFPGGGTLNSGAIITGSETLQVKFVAGRMGTTYAARGLSAFPRGFWTEDYYAPLGESAAAGRHTDYYLFNPHATPLTVNWQSQTGAGSFVIPANSTESYNRALGANPSVPAAQGLYFSAAQPFWGVGFGDSTGQAFEWGYSLLPTSFLYEEHFMGWSPGSLPLGSAPADGNSVFLTVAQDNTVVFVDYQNDGIADATNTLDRLEQWFVPVGPTGDLAGARFWATGQFSMAWGENADTATTPTPNLDLGYVALPGTDFISLALTVDKTANPTVVPAAAGSTTQFRLSTKSRNYSMSGVTVVDTLPPNWAYTNNSTTITRPDLTTLTGAGANPTITGAGTPANPFVLSWSAAQTGGAMLPNQEILITFTAQTTSAFATGTLSQNRVVSTGTRSVGSPAVVQTFSATDFAYVVTGNVQITKTSNAPTPLYPGDTFTYTVTVTNPAAAGTNLLTGVSLYDAVPAGLTNVAGTTSLSRSSVADSFNSASYALNTGTRTWATNWTETVDTGGATGDDFQVVGGELRLNNVDNVAPLITRTVNLTGATQARLAFRYRTSGNLEGTDDVLVQADQDNAGAFTTLQTITDDSSGTLSFDLTPYIGANTAIRFAMAAGDYTGTTGGGAANEFFFVDDLSITYNVAVTGPNPPDLLSTTTLYSLVGGQSLVATFNVTVDNPFPNVSPTLVNTAATTSVQIPLQLTASATNTVTTPTLLSSTVAGRLWFDANANGAQDVGEGGIDNVTVTLKDSFGTPIATATTDSNGRYLFTGVTPGNGYYVEATAPPNPGGYPSGLSQSFPIGATNDRSAAFDLSAGENYTQANLGYRATETTAIFGDFAWIDADADQIRDAGEIGITGVTLTLYRDANGNGILEPGTDTLVTTTATTPDGSYLITGITPSLAGTDTYFVSAATPAGYSATTPTSVRFTNVQQGGSYVSADFGYLPSGTSFSISDRVWYDANGNGTFNVGETGIAGVTVELLDAALNVIGTTTTAADGTFSFTGLPGGGADYTTRINDTSNVLADYYGTTSFAVARQRLESNVNANVNRTAAPSYGFNFTRSIGDTVWNDLDGDGTRDAGEPGLSGVTVTLYRDVNGNGVINVGDTVLGTVVTDTNGQYLFTGVANGTYIVSVPTQTGYNYIPGGRTDTDGASAGIQLAANVVGGANVLTRDFGFQAATPRTVTGRVWNDTNQNGIVNAGENGFAGVSVEVLSVTAGAGTISATAGSNVITGTGTNFTVLNPGDPILINGVAYIVQNVTSNTSLTLTKLYISPSASGLGWSRPGNVLQTTTTNASGDYTFSGLASAQHIVRLSDSGSALTGYGATFEVTEGLVTAGNPANFVENVNLTAGNAANVNFGYVQLGVVPTLIELRAFDAVQNRNKVRLTWQTAMESNNLGFNVYREFRGQRTKVNDKLIAGSAFLTRRTAPVAGYSYRLRDKLPASDGFVQYWLEDVDTAGERTMHGPFTPAGSSDDSLDDDDESDSAPLAGLGADGSTVASAPGFGILRPAVFFTPTQTQFTRQRELAAEPTLKVHVAREGWYRVTQAQMTAAGFDAAQLHKLAVYCEGIEVPVVATEDAIEFYGLDADTPSTGARTYWIRKTNKGLDFPVSSSNGGAPYTGTVPFTYQRIDRSVWVPNFLDTGDGENFFGPIITSTPISQELTLGTVELDAAEQARLELTLRGGTEEVDHHIRVELNGQYVDDTTLRALEARTVAWDVPHAWLLPGANQLTLTALNGDMDVSVLVSTRLSYRHHLYAQDGLLTAELPASRTVTAGGFPDGDIRALDVTNPFAPVVLEVSVAEHIEGGFEATFTTPASGRSRIITVFSSNQVHSDAELALNTPSTLVNDKKNRSADMVVITHRNFRASADALAQTRKAQNVATFVVDVDDVYDEFNFGVRSPQAIRAFLQDTQTWKKAPAHVLLVGDASIDPRGYLGLGLVDFIPTKLVPTAYLKTASDGWFADFSGTGVEDLAIGRLPVRTPEAAAVVVGKLTARGTPSGPWSQKAVMIADVPDTWNFEGSIAALTGLLPAAMAPSATTIHLGATPSPRDAVLDAMNAGSLFVDYVGHGSVGLWNHNVLTDVDATQLQNANRLPFVAAMTCLNAYFHDLFTGSLAETLLTAPDGGAIAVWSSSTLTEPGPQVVMNQELMRHIFSGSTTIGQAIRKAKQATSDANVRRSWNLLGDPSMKLTQ